MSNLTKEVAPKFLKFLAFDEVVDAFSENDSEKAIYVLERSCFSEGEKALILNLVKKEV